MAFAENLSKLLQDKNVSSYKLAKDIGVHVSTVSNWKDGKKPLVAHLLLVAKYFGCTVDDLLKEENNG